MSQIEHVRCDFCSAKITQEDLERGRSVRILKRFYCPACMTVALRSAKLKPAAAPPVRAAVPTPSPVVPAPGAKPVEHACGLYSSEEERRAQLGPFIRQGLLNREKILRFMNLPTPERILSDFLGVGLAVQPYLLSGQFEVLSAAKVLGEAGMNPVDLGARMAGAFDRAIAQGYAGLRIAAELTWALNSLIDAGRLAEFEGQLSSLAAKGRCSVLCQYNVYRLEPASLARLRKSHAALHVKGDAETILRGLAPAP